MFHEIPKNCRYDYARVSSKSQADNSSLEAQKEEFIQQGVPKKTFGSRLDLQLIPLKNDLFFKN